MASRVCLVYVAMPGMAVNDEDGCLDRVWIGEVLV